MSDGELKPCDLIMKGGITSGVVYPALISKLCEKYRFQCIGGTSAGAIAAALTAAAEVGRDKGGFKKLHDIAGELTQGTFLLDLFQPGKESKPLMDLALRLLKKKKGVRQGIARAGYLVGALWLLLSIGFCFLLWRSHPSASAAQAGWWALFAGLSALGLVALGVCLWLGYLAKIVLKVLPKHGFGLCLGRRDPDLKQYEGKEVLTDWLAKRLKECAGTPDLKRPLTFGDLWRTENPHDVEKRKVDLQIFTSNLSQGQPYVFPLAHDDLFIFKKSEFGEYFGDEVVQHMVAASDDKGWNLPDGYCVFPPPEDFPVVVAVRMSLSFPVLFRAVPVYTVSMEAEEGVQVKEEQLQKNWFSDGGICSNFPIHMFDAWFPSRPTFGVNLTSFAPDVRSKDQEEAASMVPPTAQVRLKAAARKVPATPQDPVFLPKANEAPTPQFARIADFPGFFGAILGTAKDCHDELQSMLASYRERIVQIRLKEDEGGLNLGMPQDTIKKVIGKGEAAGALLADFDFAAHQWVRMRVLLLQLAISLKEVQQVLSDGSFDVKKLFEKQADFPFSLGDDDAKALLESVLELQRLIDAWLVHARDKDEALKPYPSLRVVPPKL